MSRQLGRLLFLLALWLQVLAPVVAAQPRPAADGPLAGVPICGHAAFDAADSGAGADEHRGTVAPSCGLCCAAVAFLDAAPPGAVGVVLTWTRIAFCEPADRRADRARTDLPRARGPPSLA